MIFKCDAVPTNLAVNVIDHLREKSYCNNIGFIDYRGVPIYQELPLKSHSEYIVKVINANRDLLNNHFFTITKNKVYFISSEFFSPHMVVNTYKQGNKFIFTSLKREVKITNPNEDFELVVKHSLNKVALAGAGIDMDLETFVSEVETILYGISEHIDKIDFNYFNNGNGALNPCVRLALSGTRRIGNIFIDKEGTRCSYAKFGGSGLEPEAIIPTSLLRLETIEINNFGDRIMILPKDCGIWFPHEYHEKMVFSIGFSLSGDITLRFNRGNPDEPEKQIFVLKGRQKEELSKLLTRLHRKK